MKEENIRAIGVKKGVKDIELFIKFLSLRFPDESDRIYSYFEERGDRFNSGHPESYMDSDSSFIYHNIKNKRAD